MGIFDYSMQSNNKPTFLNIIIVDLNIKQRANLFKKFKVFLVFL